MDRESLITDKSVKMAVIVFLAIATLLLFVKTIGGVRAWNESDTATGDRPQITVSGTGDATRIPDIAQFTFTISEEGKTTKEAQDKATVKTNKALEYLKTAKIDSKDIKTVGYNVGPRYEYQTKACITNPCTPGTQVLVGYEVSQTIEVKVRDTAQAGTILSGIGALNVSNVSGLNLTVDDEAAPQQEARKEAIDDAQKKAQALAQALGVRLVRITNFQESSNGGPIYYSKTSMELQSRDTAAGNVAPQIPAGENEVVSNVTITYEIR